MLEGGLKTALFLRRGDDGKLLNNKGVNSRFFAMAWDAFANHYGPFLIVVAVEIV
ncbi:hypothetical protein GCM10007863_34660 [Dyella mobilis]|nr:hypothetical protein GCM10007863_34660 [Dyella mobilis]